MEKPLSARLHERAYGGSPMSTGLDPELVAQSFGVSYPVGESLPESRTAIIHVENETESGLVIDDINGPKEKSAQRSLYEIVTARLRSIKPRNKKRAQEVAQTLADLQEPLKALDELVATLQEEREEELQATWEQLQTQGRELKKRIDSELEGNVFTAMLAWNAAEEKRGKAKGRLGQAFDSRRAVKLDRYSTRAQIKSADDRYASAVEALQAASALHLEAERNKAQAENAKALASSKLRGIEIAMDRCVAEIQGVAFHDPATGLSIDPSAFLAQ
jgi:hypothetical protein